MKLNVLRLQKMLKICKLIFEYIYISKKKIIYCKLYNIIMTLIFLYTRTFTDDCVFDNDIDYDSIDFSTCNVTSM